MLRQIESLNAFSKKYPDAWRQIDLFREGRGKDLPSWPDWCYLPMAAFYSIVSSAYKVNSLSLDFVADVSNLTAFGLWRLTKGIYRFDSEVYEAVKATALEGDLPSDVLLRLPEWCIYIETPDVANDFGVQHGVFVHLEFDINTGRPELRLLLDCDEKFIPIAVHIGDWSLDEALDKFSTEAEKQGNLNDGTLAFVSEKFKNCVSNIISLVLYLCSQNAEFGDIKPIRPEPKRTKNGWRIFASDNPTYWDIGVRLGSAIRGYKNNYNSETVSNSSSPRPHIRRAHWHSFWTGAKNFPEKRKIVVKWIPPIPVNVEEFGVIPTVKPVK